MSQSLLQWVVDKETAPLEAAAIVLHKGGGRARDRKWNLGPAVRQYHPWSPRPVSPRSRHDESRVFFWYFEADGVIEPSLFAEHLRQLELMVFDVVQAVPKGTPILLVGEGQGATLALCLAGYWPELIRRVIASQGQVAQVDGWTPDAPRHGQRILSDRPLTLAGAKVRTVSALDEATFAWLWES